MVPSNGTARAATEPLGTEAEALEFVRFCHRRKHVGWPELYDEMCAVAGRGIYHGLGAEDLATIGIGFGLFEMPALASLVNQVVAEDQERRRRTAEAVRAVIVVASPEGASLAASLEASEPPEPASPGVGPTPEPVDRVAPDHGSIRIAVAAGA